MMRKNLGKLGGLKKVMDIEQFKKLQEENQKLKEDNENLINIIAQMKVTLNRLIDRYIAESN